MTFFYFLWLMTVGTLRIAGLIAVAFSIMWLILYPVLWVAIFLSKRLWRSATKARQIGVALVLAAVLGGTAISQAQVVCSIPCPVLDIESKIQHAIVSSTQDAMNVLKEYQAEALYKMGLRLAYWTTMSKYSVDRDTMPEWKIHNYFTDDVLYAKPFNYALSYGDKTGDGYGRVTVPRTSDGGVMGGLPPNASDAMKPQMALIEWSDSSIIRGTDTTGKLRFNGRSEADSIIAMDANVTDDDKEQSLAAVLDKVAGSALVQAQNRQTHNELKAAILEQLLLENGWDRDSDAEEMNYILAQLRGAQATAGKPNLVVAGAASALTGWRLP